VLALFAHVLLTPIPIGSRVSDPVSENSDDIETPPVPRFRADVEAGETETVPLANVL